MLYHIVSALSLASAVSAAVITVTVGGGSLTYNPNNIIAAVGDIVNFKFPSPGNHTASQAAFSAPCEQLAGGFDSGFIGTSVQYNLTITDASKPIWFYCKQQFVSPHCIAGMVGAINPPTSGNTLELFTSASKALGSLPAQTPGNATGGVGVIVSGASSGGGTSTSSGASASSTAPSGSSTASAGATHSNAAFKTSSMSSTGVWTLLAGLLGIVVA